MNPNAKIEADGLIKYRGYRLDIENGLVFGPSGAQVKGRNSGGYVYVASISMMAHRLLWEAIHGPIPGKLEINHMNGIKTDNRMCNLELVTSSGNSKHAHEMGLNTLPDTRGIKNGRAKFTEKQINDIRAATGLTYKIAEVYGVWPSTIARIRKRQSWRDTP